jgi:hypothetical protein
MNEATAIARAQALIEEFDDKMEFQEERPAEEAGNRQ